jgi:hypothetical protein
MSDMDAEGIFELEERSDGHEGVGGRLVEQGSEDVDAVDDEKDTVAHLATEDEDGLSAEESAMHITDSP